MIHGVLNIYKEKGFTSHDVVAKLRRILGQKKIGHTGTLDPEAEGVLPVCLGAATRLCDMLTDQDKTYRAVLLLGIRTDTQDMAGTVLESRPVTVTEGELKAAAREFSGSYQQIPPMYSALRVNGKRLYELAREGKTVERAARTVQIYELSVDEIALPRATLTVTCSKGTYIRTLCHDIGEKLGCGGCMEQLTRTRVGKFRIGDSIRLSELEELLAREGREEPRKALEKLVVPADQVLGHYPAGQVLPEYDRLLYNGNPLRPEMLEKDSPSSENLAEGTVCPKTEAEDVRLRVYDSRGGFCGVYGYERKKEIYRPVKMFLECRYAGSEIKDGNEIY